MRSMLMLVVLLSCAVLMAGCHTVAGTAAGAAQGAAGGAQKDYNQAKKADVWLQDNLW
ncbi:MAG: hypothetical protein WC547_03050 [Candidatus Omnitrophota bacterium]